MDDFARDMGGRMIIRVRRQFFSMQSPCTRTSIPGLFSQISEVCPFMSTIHLPAAKSSADMHLTWHVSTKLSDRTFRSGTQDEDAGPVGKGTRKRKGTLTAEEFGDDDDSDGAGAKAVRFARSTAGSLGGRSMRTAAGKSTAGRSQASRGSAASFASKASTKRGFEHSGTR